VVGPVVAYAVGAQAWAIVLAPFAAVVALQAGYIVGALAEHVFVARYAKFPDTKAGHRAREVLAKPV
jgi:hypothetical protein